MRRAVLAVAIGGLSLGCGALMALEPLTFIEEASEASAGDAPVNPPPPDAPIDTRPPDAGVPDGAEHCSDGVVHDFCDDFEGTRSSVQGNWTSTSNAGSGGALGIEGGVLVATSAGAGSSQAALSYGFTPWPKLPSGAKPKVRYRFRLKVDECLASGPAGSSIAMVFLSGPTICGGVLITLLPQGGECVAQLLENFCDADAGYDQRLSSTRIVVRGVWQQYDLELSARTPGTAGSARLTIDKDVIDFPLTFVQPSSEFGSQVGLTNIGPTNTLSAVSFDDVRLDYLH
jgi:hypothetical protein